MDRVWKYFHYVYNLTFIVWERYVRMSRNSGKYGRGTGSFRITESDRGQTPEKKMKGSFRQKKNINFDCK